MIGSERMDLHEHELDINELKEIKRSLIAHQQHIEFDATMGFNYHIQEEYDYITTILTKIDKMIEIQTDNLIGYHTNPHSEEKNNEYYNEYEEILSDGDVPF